MSLSRGSDEVYRRQRTNVAWDGDVMCLDYRGVMIVDRSEVTKLSFLLRPDQALQVRIDLRDVVHLPSGYFGQLWDGLDRGLRIWILNPTDQVQAMTWYRQFVVEGEMRICPT